MKRIAYDLHIHSCLSPCADEDMTPANIVGMASVKGLEVIALTDHNSCRNCKSAMKWGEKYGVLVIPGMELTTEEEVHVLCLFSRIEAALRFDSYVYEHLYKVKNEPSIFGRQILRDELDEICGEEEFLLIQSTSIGFDQVDTLMKEYGGIMIPAHIDRNSNSLLYNLGFVPENSKFQTVEVADNKREAELLSKEVYLRKCLMINDSDAHYLENINEPTNSLEVKQKTIYEVMERLRNSKGRQI